MSWRQKKQFKGFLISLFKRLNGSQNRLASQIIFQILDFYFRNLQKNLPLGLSKYKTSRLYYKSFMIVTYDRNDSGQYYNTIVIYNPS